MGRIDYSYLSYCTTCDITMAKTKHCIECHNNTRNVPRKPAKKKEYKRY